MRCAAVEGRICQQEECLNPATCSTTVSGFAVYACRKHHVCMFSVEDAELDCPCPRCTK